jgi:FkbM family methyltransferase
VSVTAEAGEVGAAGRRFRVDLGREAAFWRRFDAGEWEPATLEALAGLTGPQALLVDLGAWVGPTTLFAAAGGARVAAVEADPVALAWLRRNLALNPELAARVEVIDRAIWPTSGRVAFGSNRGRGGNSMSSAVHARPETRWEVETITPAQLAARLDPELRWVVKIDIEGGEYPLAEALWPLIGPAEAVLLSLHPKVASAGRRGVDALRTRARTAAASRRLLSTLHGFRARALQPGPAAPESPWTAALGLAELPRGDWLFERR